MSYEDMRRQIDRRYRRLSFFVLHLIMAITFMAMLWISEPFSDRFISALSILWTGILFFHGGKVFIDGARDRAIERTWERFGVDEKPKRRMYLTDDAEFEMDADEPTRNQLKG